MSSLAKEGLRPCLQCIPLQVRLSLYSPHVVCGVCCLSEGWLELKHAGFSFLLTLVFCALVCSTCTLSPTCPALMYYLCQLFCQDACGSSNPKLFMPARYSKHFANEPVSNKVAGIIAGIALVKTYMKQENRKWHADICLRLHEVALLCTWMLMFTTHIAKGKKG